MLGNIELIGELGKLEMLHDSIWPYDNANHLRILLEKYPNEINSTLGDDRETLLHRYV